MIVSQQKPWEKLKRYLEQDKGEIFVIGCNGCAQSSGSGGPAQVEEMVEKIKTTGKNVSGSITVDFLCQKALVKNRLKPRREQIRNSDSLLVMTCGIGVQSVATVVGKICYPACDTVYMGGAKGEWGGEERCDECGDCMLALTGGICPMTMCSKSLVNGACGGASNGKCELDKEKDCGWEKIYNRLKALDKLEMLTYSTNAKDYDKRMAYGEAIASPRWALER
ncbi:MAG: methylenetetrahydrofolate reductase C-terminal domain-containing protein [Chloroflexi bacterium]|nr:methylenetetrahydrofolate reductase C-terminal domain-containing protein [Chloroflexota bacterium]